MAHFKEDRPSQRLYSASAAMSPLGDPGQTLDESAIVFDMKEVGEIGGGATGKKPVDINQSRSLIETKNNATTDQ